MSLFLKRNKNYTAIKYVTTEYDRLDILIETDNELIAIENKVTSIATKSQLNRYEQNINNESDEVGKSAEYYLLTLIDDRITDCDNWKHLTYKHFLNCLKETPFSNHNHKVIIKEYIDYLEKLVGIVDLFILTPSDFDFVFNDGGKKKSDKLREAYNNDNEFFIASNQMETVLQRALLQHRLNFIKDKEYQISETRGTALADIFIDKYICPKSKKEFRFFLSTQGETLKLAFSLYGDDYDSSTKKDIERYISKIESFKLQQGYNRFNRPKSKARCSLSKPFKKWWQYSQDEFEKIINQELKIVIELISEIKKSLKNIEND